MFLTILRLKTKFVTMTSKLCLICALYTFLAPNPITLSLTHCPVATLVPLSLLKVVQKVLF